MELFDCDGSVIWYFIIICLKLSWSLIG
jgi:hypothetical protein